MSSHTSVLASELCWALRLLLLHSSALPMLHSALVCWTLSNLIRRPPSPGSKISLLISPQMFGASMYLFSKRLVMMLFSISVLGLQHAEESKLDSLNIEMAKSRLQIFKKPKTLDTRLPTWLFWRTATYLLLQIHLKFALLSSLWRAFLLDFSGLCSHLITHSVSLICVHGIQILSNGLDLDLIVHYVKVSEVSMVKWTSQLKSSTAWPNLSRRKMPNINIIINENSEKTLPSTTSSAKQQTTSSRSPVPRQGRKQQSRGKNIIAVSVISRAAMLQACVDTMTPHGTRGSSSAAPTITNVFHAMRHFVIFLLMSCTAGARFTFPKSKIYGTNFHSVLHFQQIGRRPESQCNG